MKHNTLGGAHLVRHQAVASAGAGPRLLLATATAHAGLLPAQVREAQQPGVVAEQGPLLSGRVAALHQQPQPAVQLHRGSLPPWARLRRVGRGLAAAPAQRGTPPGRRLLLSSLLLPSLLLPSLLLPSLLLLLLPSLLLLLLLLPLLGWWVRL